MEEYKKLGDVELEIMLIIWKSQEAVSSVYIHERLKKKRKWALSTLMSTLERLVKKGFIYCDRSTGNNLYSPLIMEDEYKARESKSFLEKLFGNSFGELVTTLYDANSIDREDIEELRKLIDKLEEK
ncbi:BlaI/MecI/CopY family transcriptional regulator [Tissierellaceae bacterium HCP3S3_D8]